MINQKFQPVKTKKNGTTIFDDFQFSGRKLEWSVVYANATLRFLEKIPLMTKEQYIRHVWYAIYPLSARFEDQAYLDKIEKIKKTYFTKQEFLKKQLRSKLGRPLNSQEHQMIELDVKYTEARDVWMETNRLINTKLGEETDYSDQVLEVQDDDTLLQY